MGAEKTAKFTVSGDNGEVQDVGYRCFLVEFFMDHGLKYKEPINSPDGSRVSVVVYGDEEIIKGVYERLKTEKPKTENVGNVKLSLIDWSEDQIDNPAGRDETMNLIFRQLNKGIPAVVNMGGVVGGLDKKYGAISKIMFFQTVILILILIALTV